MSTPAADVDVAAPDAIDELTVTADFLSWEGGRLTATGNVVVTLGPERLQARSASGTAEVLELAGGTWERASEVVRFETATVRLTTGDLVASEADFQPCRCADGGRPALSFRARSFTVLNAEVAIIRGGSVRVFDVPVVPIPYWREPLDPNQFRLEFPELGFSASGWQARWLGRVGVGESQVKFGPAWREDRGGRLVVSAAGPAQLDGEVGWDSQESRVRGAVSSHGGASPGTARVAWDATVQSDLAYAEDMAPAFVDRGVLWNDRRLLAAIGPLRAAGWLPSDDSAGTVAQLTVRPEWGNAGFAVAPRVTLGARRAESGDPLSALAPALRAGADARASATLDLFHAEVIADAAIDPLAADLSPAWGGLVRAEVPFWAEFAGGRAQFYAGGRAGWSEGDPLDLTAAPAGAAGVGPSLRASAALGDVVLTAEAAALYDGAWGPLLSAQASGERGSLRAELSADQQLVAVRTSGTWAVEAGALRAGDTALGWGDVTWHPGRFLAGGGVSQGFTAGSLPAGVARLGYDDGCSALLVSAGFSPDRELPDFGVQLQLRK